MSDVDEELLALAGDSSSDEEDAPMNISRDSSVAQGQAQKSGRKSSGRGKADSEEEGEAQSSPNSLKSAAMDESDSDSDAGEMYEQGELFPLEGKFKDATEKEEIMAMPEIQREELLADRAQLAERDRQTRALRQLLNAREAGNKNKDKKRKAGAADLDEDEKRKTNRQRTKVGGGRVGEASSGIDNLKRARAEKTDRQRRRQEDKDRYGDTRGNGRGYSDDDASGESDVEWDNPKSKRHSPSPPPKDAPLADLRDINRVRTGRSQFARVCFYPGFNEAITGCFARVSVGPNPDTGENVYRMALIKGFEEGKPYAMETENGKQFTTNQYIVAAHGKMTTPRPFISCSNSPFTEAEFNRYIKTCQVEEVPLPTKPKLSAKIDDINGLANRSWTEAELQEKLKKSGALASKDIGIERTKLVNQMRANAGDEAKVAEFKAKLQALDGPKLAYGPMRPSPKKTVSGEMNQQEALARLNRENRRKNAAEVRQAQINERKAQRAAEAALARGEIVAQDHSRRVKTTAKFKHDVADTLGNGKIENGTVANASTAVLESAQMANAPISTLTLLEKMKSERKGLPTLRRPLCDDDIIGSLDLDIDIDIDIDI